MNEVVKTVAAPAKVPAKMTVLNQMDRSMTILENALLSGVDADSLDKLLSMQERMMDRAAAQEYATAMTALQRKIPTITKNRDNDQTNSSYADLEQVLDTVKPLYVKQGFSFSFSEQPSSLDNHIHVECTVMHKLGHREIFTADLPVDMTGIKGSPNKTATHGTTSAISYSRRYLMAMILNLNTGDDDDGNAAGQPALDTLAPNQIANIDALISEVGADRAAFLDYMQVDKVADIFTCNYQVAVKALEAKRAQS